MNLKSFLTTLSLLGFVVAQAQTADQILEKYFAAIGGKDKLKSVKTITTTQKLSMAMMGMELSMTQYSKAPNKQKVVANLQGAEMIQAFDGKQAWGNNPMQGSKEPQILPIEQAEAMADQPFVSVFLDYTTKGHVVNYLGTEDIAGVKCYKLELIKNKNNDKADVTEVHFFDAENYVPVVVKSTVMGQDVATYFSDYQDAGGVMFAFLQEGKLGDQTVTKITIEKITLNASIDDSFFEFPKK